MTRRILIITVLAVLLAACGSKAEPSAAPGATPLPPTLTAPPATPTITPAPASPTLPKQSPTTTQTAAPASTAMRTATATSSATPEATRTPVPPTSSPTAIPTMVPLAIETQVRPQDSMLMVHVPAGEFLMGSAGRANANEKPQHTVFLDAFWIDRTEVTVAQFRLFIQASGYITRAEKKGRAFAWVESAKEWQEVDGADWLHPFGPESHAEDDHPVVQVSWFDAAAYCAWAGGSLPSEAQWEKAARGTDGRTYPWGDLFDGTWLNYCDASCEGGDSAFDDGYRFTAPVGSYPANASPYGALDMSGNVWEWTADYYDDGYYAVSPAQNPAGPDSGQFRVLRGGSWNHDRSGMRTAFRLDSSPGFSVDNFGFRCAVNP
jgi:formylglycine-generating enzyme required for sulfatase activity